MQLFGERGIVADWERDGDVFLLHERTCPFPEVARRNSISCAMEVAEVRLLTGMDARLQSCIVRGDECCTYRLSRSMRRGRAPADGGGQIQLTVRPAVGRSLSWLRRGVLVAPRWRSRPPRGAHSP